jgi:hypothetical protein
MKAASTMISLMVRERLQSMVKCSRACGEKERTFSLTAVNDFFKINIDEDYKLYVSSISDAVVN